MSGRAQPGRLVVFTDQTDIDLEPARAYLADQGFSSLCLSLDRDTQVPAAARAAVGGIVGYAQIGPAVMDQLPNLRVLATTSTGADMVDAAAAEARGVVVLPMADASTEEVAAHTVALVLSAIRRLDHGREVVRQGGWTEQVGQVPPALSQMTLGLVGFGRIGRKVADYLGPMVGAVLAADPAAEPAKAGAAPNPADAASPARATNPARDAGPARRAQPTGWIGPAVRLAGLPEVLACSDIISLHLPLTGETEHLIDAAALAAMKDGTLLVNVSRGRLVDSQAVLAALESGRLAAYCADVADCEPPLAGDPLLFHPRTIATPHMAFLSTASLERYQLDPARNLVNWLKRQGGDTA
ncbi:MAG: hypothetical protein LBC97_12095 [Bifidobacteriaceae bacterium]|jgi:D-3-phosphoglycerate dehydrogenase|nr:hypothetical protein [Bifidobacteriaceae bacterium]